MSDWPIEEIPNDASLFYRVPVGGLRSDKKVAPGVFRENKGSMSSDWDKYSSATETRCRPGAPERFAVLRMLVGGVREIEQLSVCHAPIQNVVGQQNNRAHTNVFGLETPALGPADLGRKERIRSSLYERFKTWEIAPGAPID